MIIDREHWKKTRRNEERFPRDHYQADENWKRSGDGEKETLCGKSVDNKKKQRLLDVSLGFTGNQPAKWCGGEGSRRGVDEL